MNIEQGSYQSIIENLHDGLYFVTLNRVITYWNKAAERISGFSAEEVISKSCADNILTHVDCNGNNLCTGKCPLLNCMKSGEPNESKIYLHHKKGHRVPVSVRVSPLKNKEGKTVGGIELFTDLSNQEANELRVKELEKLAYLDTLTQLANRAFMEQELINCLKEKEKLNLNFGVLFMDIDYFKQFNDKYGHDVGDKVLQFVAHTFRSNARAFDIYGRWGGEEFMALIRNIDDYDKLRAIGNRIRILIEKSYLEHNGKKLQVNISIGATLAQDNDDEKRIIKRADSLLYQSKHGGRNRLSIG